MRKLMFLFLLLPGLSLAATNQASITGGYSKTQTVLTIPTAEMTKVPDPAGYGAYPATFYNKTFYTNPTTADLNYEIVKIVGKSSATAVTVLRAQSSTTAKSVPTNTTWNMQLRFATGFATATPTATPTNTFTPMNTFTPTATATPTTAIFYNLNTTNVLSLNGIDTLSSEPTVGISLGSTSKGLLIHSNGPTTITSDSGGYDYTLNLHHWKAIDVDGGPVTNGYDPVGCASCLTTQEYVEAQVGAAEPTPAPRRVGDIYANSAGTTVYIGISLTPVTGWLQLKP